MLVSLIFSHPAVPAAQEECGSRQIYPEWHQLSVQLLAESRQLGPTPQDNHRLHCKLLRHVGYDNSKLRFLAICCNTIGQWLQAFLIIVWNVELYMLPLVLILLLMWNLVVLEVQGGRVESLVKYVSSVFTYHFWLLWE